MNRLIVKVADQSFADQTVECDMDWTVKQLKEHLCKVHSGRPNLKDQRLVYYGRLLADYLKLGDALKRFKNSIEGEGEDEESCYVIHLVCPSLKKQQPPPVMPAGPFEKEGLRHRTTTASTATPQQQHPATAYYNYMYQSYQNVYGQPAPQGAAAAPMAANSSGNTPGSPPSASAAAAGHPPSYGAATAGHANYMTAAYQQQQAYLMQQFMYAQYMNTLYASPYSLAWAVSPDQAPPRGTPPLTQPQPGSPPPPMPGVQQAQPAADPAQRPRPPPAAPVNQMAMGGGAGGIGLAVEDDGDEAGGDGQQAGDWLDWLHTGSRFAILFSIVYFYSSLNRFLLVMGLVMTLYIFRLGLLSIRRGQQAREQQRQEAAEGEGVPENSQDNQNNQQQPDAAEETTQEDEQQEERSGGGADSQGDDDSSPGDSEEAATTPPPTAEQDRPNTLTIAWSFVSTFFTSLIPYNPPLPPLDN